MNQSTTVAIIVVVTFGAGFLVGRASVGTSGPAAPAAASASAPAPAAEAPRPFPSAAAPAAPAAAPAMPPMAAAPMMGAPQAAGAETEPVAGELEETIQVPNFTYLRLKTSRGDEWAAVPTDNTLKNGQQVSIAKPMKMVNFTSKTLNRTFDSIWFGTLGK